ncbi:hypothetical protein JZ751_008124 [Albula glossodonta]|uniref:Uncharacterized protein n=1 Tax=Albula glossodonta TaxID=121402 RepID=A0A8T2P1U5_9TELE|nr:hypothetical protein JZ751_008124 [Albula glossodonta]
MVLVGRRQSRSLKLALPRLILQDEILHRGGMTACRFRNKLSTPGQATEGHCMTGKANRNKHNKPDPALRLMTQQPVCKATVIEITVPSEEV